MCLVERAQSKVHRHSFLPLSFPPSPSLFKGHWSHQGGDTGHQCTSSQKASRLSRRLEAQGVVGSPTYFNIHPVLPP